MPTLVCGNKVVAMHFGCGPRPLLRDWFREDGLCGQNLNMVLTITTMNSNYTILLLIHSQINNYKLLGRNSYCRLLNALQTNKSLLVIKS